MLRGGNADDATRDGAYSLSLAAIESTLNLVAISRAETRSGADYYVGAPDAVNLEDAFRLQISGTDLVCPAGSCGVAVR